MTTVKLEVLEYLEFAGESTARQAADELGLDMPAVSVALLRSCRAGQVWRRRVNGEYVYALSRRGETWLWLKRDEDADVW